ncbi:unnamed protein product [Calypogeia fissa]
MMPRDVHGILAFDVGKGTLKLLDVQGRRVQNPEGYNLSTILEVCDANLLMIDIARTYESDPTTTVAHPTHDEITILKIDLESLHVLELAKGPPAELDVKGLFDQQVSDGNCITFWEKSQGGRLLEYNIVADRLSVFAGPPPVSPGETETRCLGASFKPGLNPLIWVLLTFEDGEASTLCCECLLVLLASTAAAPSIGE